MIVSPLLYPIKCVLCVGSFSAHTTVPIPNIVRRMAVRWISSDGEGVLLRVPRTRSTLLWCQAFLQRMGSSVCAMGEAPVFGVHLSNKSEFKEKLHLRSAMDGGRRSIL